MSFRMSIAVLTTAVVGLSLAGAALAQTAASDSAAAAAAPKAPQESAGPNSGSGLPPSATANSASRPISKAHSTTANNAPPTSAVPHHESK
jgi:hypothetical protein